MKEHGRWRFVCLMDVPTPYRVHFFNALARELRTRGVDFEVWFMASSVRTRNWTIGTEGWEFPHRVLSGFHPVYRGTTMHVNPLVLTELTALRPELILVGAGWQVPSSALVMLARRVALRQTTVLFWAEANVHSMRYRGRVMNAFRRLVLGRVDALAVPGAIARETVTEHWGIQDPSFVQLPNVVDEKVFGSRLVRGEDRNRLREKWQVPARSRVLLWPARLSERDKGIVNFLRCAEGVLGAGTLVLHAGEGPDRPVVEKWLRASELRASVRLLGWQSVEAMAELYSLSDALLLPSIRDPNPLSVVEALWTGLPVLLSNRCGNWPEAVSDHNGWVFDPADADAVGEALRQFQMAPADQLNAMGLRSHRVAEREFSTQSAVSHFADEVLHLHGRRPDSRRRPDLGES